MSMMWFSMTPKARVFNYGNYLKTRTSTFEDDLFFNCGATKRRVRHADSDEDGSSPNDDDSNSDEDEPVHKSRLDLWEERSDVGDGFKWLHRLLKHVQEASVNKTSRQHNKMTLRHLRKGDLHLNLDLGTMAGHLLVDLVSPEMERRLEGVKEGSGSDATQEVDGDATKEADGDATKEADGDATKEADGDATQGVGGNTNADA
ncbi:hypothetical protein Hte_007631 [Hypoxylon texense]